MFKLFKLVGIVACSGEDLPEGTISRMAARIVLDKLRPKNTATICLPLLLAGGEEDRGFVKNFHTITIDGCEKRCAEKSILQFGGKPPSASILIPEVLGRHSNPKFKSKVELGPIGKKLAMEVAEEVASKVDEILKVEEKEV